MDSNYKALPRRLSMIKKNTENLFASEPSEKELLLLLVKHTFNNSENGYIHFSGGFFNNLSTAFESDEFTFTSFSKEPFFQDGRCVALGGGYGNKYALVEHN